MAVPMLLFGANIKKIRLESGRMFLAFWFAALGTSVGAILATLLLHRFIPELGQLAGMITASYVGGGVNFVAAAFIFHPSDYLTNATIVADNLLMALFFFLYILIPTLPFFRKHFPLSYPVLTADDPQTSEAGENAVESTSTYWGKKEISLKDIAVTIAISVSIAAVGSKLGDLLYRTIPTGGFLLDMINTILSNQYFIMTVITVTLVAVFSEFFDQLASAQEIGTFFVYLFFIVIALPASISDILKNAPLLFVFCAIIAFFNLASVLIASKLTHKISLEEAVLAANATVGGPTTAAAMAISKGWQDHIIPSLLCGLTGYIMGNFIGIFVGNLLIAYIY